MAAYTATTAAAAWPKLFDPSDWFDAIVRKLAAGAASGLDNLWNLLSRTALATPDVTSLAQVRELNATALTVVDCGYGLVILVAGALLMVGDSMAVRYRVGDLAPRVVFGFIAAHFAPLAVGALIEVSNGVTGALTGGPISSAGSFDQLRTTVSESIRNPTNLLLSLSLCVVIAVLTALLMIGWLVRIGVLVVLAGLGPLALSCHGLPQLDPVAKLWWRSLTATLATVVLQAVLLHSTLRIFLDPHANRRALGLDHANSGSLNLLIVVALMWATVKIPGLLTRYVLRSSGGGAGMAGNLLRVVLVQQISRGISTAVRRVPGRPGPPTGRRR